MSKPYSLVSPLVVAEWLSMARATPEGCFLEVGVYQGGTAYDFAALAEEQGRPIFLFDTFTGIPYTDPVKGDRHPVGDFGDTSAAAVREAIPYATVIEGIFPGTAPPNLPPVAFAHLDCDQYQSIVDSVRFLESRMVPGGFIAFDDYGCLEGATNAVHDLYPKKRIHLAKSGKAYVYY